MREWQNVKARLHAGPAPSNRRGDPEAERDANVDQEHVPGVLELVLHASGDREDRGVKLVSMRLRDAEPAARQHFRKAALRLPEVGLNQRFEVHVMTYNHLSKIVFGVGPDRGLLAESLGTEELAVLKVMAARDPVTSRNVFLARKGEYERVTDAAALRIANAFVKRVSMLTTASLED
jgi:hypothetical protein